jgi:response regulator NasT
MRQADLEEQEAFRRLQKLASSQNRKLIEVAQMILRVDIARPPPATH